MMWSEEMCEVYIPDYTRAVLEVTAGRINSQLCTRMSLCDDFQIKSMDHEKFKNELLKNKPPIEIPVIPDNPKNLTVVQIGDVHIDFEYEAVKPGLCY